MKTEILTIDRNNIDIDKIKYAAQVLLNKGLIAFPTETVYGLGAVVSCEESMKKIFTVKGRPVDNPLIVHISNIGQLEEVAYINSYGRILAEKFWPGPLTMILNRKEGTPNIISAGLPTVAVRMPSDKIALELINQCNTPIAAPSANISGRPSTTNAAHVIEDLSGLVPLIIDGGNCEFGIESTIIDITSDTPIILRPGSITLSQLQSFLPNTIYNDKLKSVERPVAPGMKYKHYSPNAEVIIVDGSNDFIVSKINSLHNEFHEKGKNVGVLATDQNKNKYFAKNVFSLGCRNHPQEIAANLFALLRKFDRINVDIILAESLESHDLGYSIMNRMIKAAGFNIIKP